LVMALPLVLWLFQDQYFGQLPVGFYILLITTFLVSTLTQFFAPAEQSAIPLVVEKRHLLSANSLYTTTMMASVIVGFAVGEPLLALADLIANQIGLQSIGKELIVGGEYVIAGLILMLLNTQEKNNNSDHEQPHVLEDLRDGIRYLSNHTLIRNALLQLIILFSIFAALAVLAVRLAEIIPDISSSQFGFLLAAGGAGMGLGATLLGHLGHRFTHFQLALMGSFGVAGSLGGLSLFNERLWPTLILIFCLGIFGAIVAIPMQTTIQAETPQEMRGKVFGLQNNAINIALSLPLALAGFAETLIGLSNVFMSLAGLAIAGGFLTWLISRNAPHITEAEAEKL
ncbi:MAG: MFS transporter, partial [Planktothrix sp.]